MKLPRDRQEWHDGHLHTAIRERDHAFDRYEQRVDFERRERTDHLYADYLRKDDRVRDIAIVVNTR